MNILRNWLILLLCACLNFTSLAVVGDELAKDYRLGPGDVIKISVYESPDLTTEMRISETGNISFPLIGVVNLGGQTLSEAEKTIVQRLDEFVRNPQVTIVVVQFISQKISVLGLVNKPGQYSVDTKNHVIDLLALAGGMTIPAAADIATLVRSDGSKVPIDMLALLAGDPTQNLRLIDGDVIFVPKAPQFYIYGEVKNPGKYKLERGLSVTQAISLGGGLTSKGTDNWPKPVIKRLNGQGEEQEIDVEGASLLQPDDVLFIKESWF